MNRKQPLKNMAASVRDRLKAIQQKTAQDYQTLLIRYGIERLLFRLSRSPHKDRFVLKGALLFAIWQEAPHRVTRDLDLLGFGESSIEELAQVFQEVCRQQVESDGLEFAPGSIHAEPIRSQELYAGIRITVLGRIGNARIPLQIDVGFGDATAVDPVDAEFPSLIGMPAPTIKTYRMESSLAEKYEAMVALGMLNSRMKDYFDFWFLGKHFAFDGQSLSDSIRATFARRGRILSPITPAGLSDSFWKDVTRQTLWRAFWKKSVKTNPMISLEEAVSFAASFLVPPAVAAAKGQEFSGQWPVGGPWK